MTSAIDYQSGLDSAWTNIATFIPKFVVFLIILVIGYVIAKAMAKILTKVLERVGFDDVVERGGVKKALAKSEYDPSDFLAKLVFYAIMLFVLSMAFGVFGPNPISDYLKAVISYLPLIFVAIVIVVVTAAIAAAAKKIIENSLGGLSYATVLANVAAGLIIALGVIAALDQLHIATNVVNAVLYAALAAMVGVVIVAVGGGGITTMSQRWETVAAKYDEEKPRIAEAARNAPSLKDQAQQARTLAQQQVGDGQPQRPQPQPQYAPAPQYQTPPAPQYRPTPPPAAPAPQQFPGGGYGPTRQYGPNNQPPQYPGS